MIETWSFQHPEHGLIEVKTGSDDDFREIYPDWPEPSLEVKGPPLVRKYFGTRTVVLIDGLVAARLEEASNTKTMLTPTRAKGWSRTPVLGERRDKPHVQLMYGPTKDLLEVYYREGEQIAEFAPPEGSRAEKRRQAMDESPIKRLVFPVLAGMGKAGWAIFVIVVLPLLSRLFGWAFDFLPPIPMPDLPDLPDLPPLPQIALPVLPPIPWPDINWPDIRLPEWLELVLAYEKIWMPILIGVVLGVIALRRSTKAREQKDRWDYSASQPMSSMGNTEKPPAP